MSEKTPRATTPAKSCRKKTAKKEKILWVFLPFLKLLIGVLMDSNLFQQIGLEYLLYYLVTYVYPFEKKIIKIGFSRLSIIAFPR